MSEESWEVLSSETVLQHPFLTVRMERVRLPDGGIIPDWPIAQTRDYVNAFVLNGEGCVMVQEGYKHGIGRSSWQMPGGYLEPGEEPQVAMQRELLEETGYTCDSWQPLGSFVVGTNRRFGTGSFYLAQGARLACAPTNPDAEAFQLKWVLLEDLERALQDGRVAGLAYAANIALALLALRSP